MSREKNADAFFLLGCCSGLEAAAVLCDVAERDERYSTEGRAKARVLARQIRKLKEETAEKDGLLGLLEKRGVVTTDLEVADECCGIPRDDDGFCVHRPGHPIYVGPRTVAPG